MKFLENIYRILVLLYICPNRKSTKRWIKIRNILFLALNVAFGFLSLLWSMAFIVKYFTIDLSNALSAGFQVGATFFVFYTIIVALFLRHDIAKVFDDIQTIYDLSMIIFSSISIRAQSNYNFYLIHFRFQKTNTRILHIFYWRLTIAVNI